MDTRSLILDAALDVFADGGSRAATTRRIAAAAGVNEVTLFRHFGTKEALLDEALQHAAQRAAAEVLPAGPERPREALETWCVAHLRALCAARSLLRASFAEVEDRTAARRLASDAPARMTEDLRAWVARLQAAGKAAGEVDRDAAAAMLMGAMLADAISRDVMPERYPADVEESARQYARLFLRMIGAEAE